MAAFIVAGVPLVSFHGDETIYMNAARDFDLVFLQGKPNELWVDEIWATSASYQRVITGTVTRYAIGFFLHLAGYPSHQWAENGNYFFGRLYDDNITMGMVPPQAMIIAARLPSALFLGLSAAALFGIAYLVGGRVLAYPTSLLYVLNPVVLLNGRRAMQEGALLGFGVLVILVAAVISLRREQGKPVRLWWAGLVGVSALALASKQTGFAYVAAAFGWVAIAEAARFKPRALVSTGLRLIGCGSAVIVLYYALSPGLWHANPVQRFRDMYALLQDAMRVQISFTPNAPATFGYRIENILSQPFIAPVQHFEAYGFQESPLFMQQVVRYMASPLSGLQYGNILGTALMTLALQGLAVNAFPVARGYRSRALALGLYVWLGVALAVALTNPLPWQRYYLILIPPLTMFSVIGGLWIARSVAAQRAQPRSIIPSSVT
jgi:4-amino-4-deoxy-L-arabinose transferase-like glycosyltransferase